MFEQYLAAHPGPNFASEIAFTLGLELETTFNAINELLEEGIIKKAKGTLKRSKIKHGHSS
jgi:DNA-binding MarR family transcriptional regulator